MAGLEDLMKGLGGEAGTPPGFSKEELDKMNPEEMAVIPGALIFFFRAGSSLKQKVCEFFSAE
jgi:hypothetical protein